MAYDIGQLVGAFVGYFLWSRILWWAAKPWHPSLRKLITLSVLSYLLFTLAYSVGSADGGPPPVLAAATLFLLPAMVFFAIDGLALRGRLVRGRGI